MNTSAECNLTAFLSWHHLHEAHAFCTKMVRVGGCENIYQASFFLYYILKALGMAFFFYSVEAKLRKFKVSCWHYLGLVFILTYWILQNILYFETQVTYDSGLKFRIIESIWRTVFAFQYLCTIPIILFNFIKRKHLENFLQLIEKFDAQMEVLEWENKVKISAFFSLMPFYPIPILICNNTMILIFELSENFYLHPTYVYHVKFIAYLTITEMFFIICYIFVFSCNCISKRIDLLVENMR